MFSRRACRGSTFFVGVAILAVVFFHGFAYSAPHFPWHSRLAGALFHLTSFGWTGVNLFFTLSGFLITGNLIDSDGKPNFYLRFYIRRALRILPAYFLVLIVLGLTRTASLNYLAVCVMFLANWPKLLLHGSFVLYPVLWALAVEEQFYAVWPWLYRRSAQERSVRPLRGYDPVLSGAPRDHDHPIPRRISSARPS